MCGCTGSKTAAQPSVAGPVIRSTKYDLVLPSGRVLSYLTAIERDAAAAFYGIDTSTPDTPEETGEQPTSDETSDDTPDTAGDQTEPADSNTSE